MLTINKCAGGSWSDREGFFILKVLIPYLTLKRAMII